jgi:hypothetical protein
MYDGSQFRLENVEYFKNDISQFIKFINYFCSDSRFKSVLFFTIRYALLIMHDIVFTLCIKNICIAIAFGGMNYTVPYINSIYF